VTQNAKNRHSASIEQQPQGVEPKELLMSERSLELPPGLTGLGPQTRHLVLSSPMRSDRCSSSRGFVLACPKAPDCSEGVSSACRVHQTHTHPRGAVHFSRKGKIGNTLGCVCEGQTSEQMNKRPATLYDEDRRTVTLCEMRFSILNTYLVLRMLVSVYPHGERIACRAPTARHRHFQ
jgi:hypothetical protein